MLLYHGMTLSLIGSSTVYVDCTLTNVLVLTYLGNSCTLFYLCVYKRNFSWMKGPNFYTITIARRLKAMKGLNFYMITIVRRVKARKVFLLRRGYV